MTSAPCFDKSQASLSSFSPPALDLNTTRGFSFFSMESRVTITFSMLDFDGISYIKSSKTPSRMARRPRAPVLRRIALSATAFTARLRKFRSLFLTGGRALKQTSRFWSEWFCLWRLIMPVRGFSHLKTKNEGNFPHSFLPPSLTIK